MTTRRDHNHLVVVVDQISKQAARDQVEWDLKGEFLSIHDESVVLLIVLDGRKVGQSSSPSVNERYCAREYFVGRVEAEMGIHTCAHTAPVVSNFATHRLGHDPACN